MAKPITLPRWSSVSPGTTTIAPTSGKLDTGFVTSERPAARHLNWLLYWIYQWILWLSNSGNAVRAPGGGYAETAGWAHMTDGFIQTTTNGSTWLVPLDLAVGTIITSARFRCLPNGATHTITCSIVKYLDEAVTSVASQVSTASGMQWVTVASSFTVANGEFYAAKFEATGGGANQRRASIVELNP